MQLLSTHYGSTLQPEAMRADPTYALSELFAFAASSESQFLNLMQAQVESAITSYEDQEELSRKSLIYNKKLVDEHVRYIRETICSLKSRGESRWPKAKDLETVAESLINLQGDFCHLLERAEHVAARCLEGIEIIINAVQLEEARKGIRQGEEMHRLTILAFFFLPLSLVASIFGMNFTEFGQGHLHIWLAGIVVVPVIAVSVVLGFWDHISEKGRLLRRRSSHLSPAT
jgi:Mg2+ and Co2+ transporter CorA